MLSPIGHVVVSQEKALGLGQPIQVRHDLIQDVYLGQARAGPKFVVTYYSTAETAHPADRLFLVGAHEVFHRRPQHGLPWPNFLRRDPQIPNLRGQDVKFI
jgi:hypothetical protein